MKLGSGSWGEERHTTSHSSRALPRLADHAGRAHPGGDGADRGILLLNGIDNPGDKLVFFMSINNAKFRRPVVR